MVLLILPLTVARPSGQLFFLFAQHFDATVICLGDIIATSHRKKMVIWLGEYHSSCVFYLVDARVFGVFPCAFFLLFGLIIISVLKSPIVILVVYC